MEEEKKKKKKTTKTKKANEEKVKPVIKNSDNKKKKKKKVKKVVKPVEDTKEELLEKTYIFSKDEKSNLDEVVSELNKDKIVVENDVVDRNPFNRNIIIGLLTAIIIIICCCTTYVIKNGLKEEEEPERTTIIDGDAQHKIDIGSIEDEEEPSKSSDSFADIEYSNIVNTDINKFEIQVAKGEDMLVLISSETCLFCIKFEPVLNEVLSEKDNTVLRLNISKMNKKEKTRLRNYYAFESAPTLLVIRKGMVTADLIGYQTKEEFSKWYKENIES